MPLGADVEDMFDVVLMNEKLLAEPIVVVVVVVVLVVLVVVVVVAAAAAAVEILCYDRDNLST